MFLLFIFLTQGGAVAPPCPYVAAPLSGQKFIPLLAYSTNIIQQIVATAKFRKKQRREDKFNHP